MKKLQVGLLLSFYVLVLYASYYLRYQHRKNEERVERFFSFEPASFFSAEDDPKDVLAEVDAVLGVSKSQCRCTSCICTDCSGGDCSNCSKVTEKIPEPACTVAQEFPGQCQSQGTTKVLGRLVLPESCEKKTATRGCSLCK